MFESLKAKMKNLFSKADKKLDKDKIYKEEEPEQTPTPIETPKVEEKPVEVPAPETVKEEPKLSRKELLKLKKQEKLEKKAAAKVYYTAIPLLSLSAHGK